MWGNCGPEMVPGPGVLGACCVYVFIVYCVQTSDGRQIKKPQPLTLLT